MSQRFEDFFEVHTFGCKVNTYDTGLLQSAFAKDEALVSKFAETKDGRRIHILNSCAVTHEATREASRTARRIKSKDPSSVVVMTGCAAQVDGKILDGEAHIDLIVGNSHKSDLFQLIQGHLSGEMKLKTHRSNIFRNEQLGAGGGEESQHTRSFLKIQDGCNSFCSYCIIPYARGKSRSLTIASMIERVNELYRQGVREVVLTGIHIGDYGDLSEESGRGLEDLLEDLLAFTRMPRFRLTSLEPPELTARLLQLLKNERMCRHVHMSIQSAEDSVLSGMKRNYSASDVTAALESIERELPGAFVGMDVITGFPGETDEKFEITYHNLSRSPWTRIHVFPYSERQGTKAALMSESSVPVAVRKERAKRLRALSHERYQMEALKQRGTVKSILLLKDEKNEEQGRRLGLSRDYWNCVVDETVEPDANGEVRVLVTGFDPHPQTGKTGWLNARVFSNTHRSEVSDGRKPSFSTV